MHTQNALNFYMKHAHTHGIFATSNRFGDIHIIVFSANPDRMLNRYLFNIEGASCYLYIDDICILYSSR